MRIGTVSVAVAVGIFALGVSGAPPGAAAQVKSASDKVSVQLYGQVNRAFLWADDGDRAKVYFVDNTNSSTRFGVNAKAKIEGGPTVGAKFEAEIMSNASSSATGISQVNEKTGPVTFNERHFDAYVEGGFGKLSLGQGDTASNETSECDLSGTRVIAISDVDLLAGGIIFFDGTTGSLYENPAEADPLKLKVNPRVRDVFDNLDGLSRDDRVRYDSPRLAGFQVSASAVAQRAWDAALRYSGEFGGTRLDAAVAWADPADQNTLVDGQVNGSVSVLLPVGVSVTAAAGRQSLDDPARTEDPLFWYGKLGYTAKFFPAGTTSVAVDHMETSDFKKDRDEATSTGLLLVQRFDDYNTELYAGCRAYSLERTGRDFQDVTALMTGVRVKF